jgi:hypothetical protein
MSAKFTDKLAAICGIFFLIGLILIIVAAVAKMFMGL